MAVASWNPWTEFETFEHVLHRVFALPFPRLFDNGHHEPWQPCTDISETDAAYVVEVDLPGMTIHDISVRLEGTTVVVAGQRQSTHPESVNHRLVLNARVAHSSVPLHCRPQCSGMRCRQPMPMACWLSPSPRQTSHGPGKSPSRQPD